MKGFFWLLLLLLPFSVAGQQPGFSRVYKAGTYGCMFHAIEPLASGSMMVSAYALDSTDSVHTGIKFLRFDAAGDIKATGFFTLPEDSLFVWYQTKGMTRMGDDNRYAALATVESNTGGRSWVVAVADSNGQTVRYEHLPILGCANATLTTMMDITYDTANHALLAFGLVECPHPMWLLVKLDTTLQVSWSKQYGYPNHINFPRGIMYEEDGYTMYGLLQNFESSNSLNLVDRSMMIKVDTAGNEQWSYLTPAGQLNGHIRDLVRTPDGGYAYVATGDVLNFAPAGAPVADWRGRGIVVKLDATRQLQWMDAYPNYRPGWGGDAYGRLVRVTADGNLLAAGPSDDSTGLHQYDAYAGVRKYSMSGQLLWDLKYKATDTLPWNMESYAFTDAYLKPDGGFVFAGEFWNETLEYLGDNGPPHGWLVSTDSMGCRFPGDTLCQATAVQPIIIPRKEISIYPNPTTQTITIECPQRGNDGYEVIFSDIRGVEIARGQMKNGQRWMNMDVSSWTPGIYIYSCRIDNKVLQVGRLIKI